MNKLIFPALMLTIPIFSSINLIACDNRKIYEKIIKKNPGSFIIKKISQEELPNKIYLILNKFCLILRN